MPNLEFFLVSESVSTDQRTNQLSLFSVLEDLTVDPLPGVLPRLFATSSWNIKADERGKDYQVILRIYSPSGELLETPGDISINFTAERSRQRIHHDVRGLPIEEPGDWKFEILLNGEHAASHTMTIRTADETS